MRKGSSARRRGHSSRRILAGESPSCDALVLTTHTAMQEARDLRRATAVEKERREREQREREAAAEEDAQEEPDVDLTDNRGLPVPKVSRSPLSIHTL